MLGVRERQEGLDLKNIFGDQYSLIHLMWLYSNEYALYIFTKVTKKWVLQESWSWRMHKVPGNLPLSWPQSVNVNYGVDSQHSPLTILAPTGIFQFCPLENHKRPYQRSYLNQIKYFCWVLHFWKSQWQNQTLHQHTCNVCPILTSSFRGSNPHLHNIGLMYLIVLTTRQHTSQYRKSFIVTKSFHSYNISRHRMIKLPKVKQSTAEQGFNPQPSGS